MIYVLQVMASNEEKIYKKLIKKGYRALLPQQVKYQRKGGKWHIKTINLFQGYVFIESDLKYDEYVDIQNTQGVIGFLTSVGATNPEPLGEVDSAFIKWLANEGEAIKPLSVTFNEDGKMTILDDFKKYKDKVVKVDRRQRRIKVLLDFGNIKKEVTLYINDIYYKGDKGLKA